MMPDREKILNGLRCHSGCERSLNCQNCDYISQNDCSEILAMDVLNLLKEQEAAVKQWTKEIADMQLTHAPNDYHGFMPLDEYLENKYKKGIWDGLQIAWNIISEGR